MKIQLALRPAFPNFCPLTEAVETLAVAGSIEERGAIYTKREVVNFILDLIGYTEDAPLRSYRLLEPSFGDGDFLLPAIDRLLSAAKRDGNLSFEALALSVRAIELHRATYDKARRLVAERLLKVGFSSEDTLLLCDTWLLQGDFLLAGLNDDFTHVVGNPPYIRQESIPDILIAEYRKRYTFPSSQSSKMRHIRNAMIFYATNSCRKGYIQGPLSSVHRKLQLTMARTVT